MTIDELKQYNGRDGNKAYVAYNNVVYDVTESPLWKEGEHEGAHFAGEDLTAQLSGAPHGDDVFEGFPVVDKLEPNKPQKENPPPSPENIKSKYRNLYQKYHPHAMTVHFPIALHLFAAGLDLVFFFSPKESYALSVFYTFLVATAMGLAAMVPGIVSWWVNYNLSMSRPFVIKLVVSVLTLLLGIVNVVIYLEDPAVVYTTSFAGITYHGIVLLTGLAVIVLGYYGGKITWGSASELLDESEKKEKTMDKEKEAGSAQPLKMSPKSATVSAVKGHRTVSLLIGGAAGSGIETIEKILTDAFKASGYYVFSTKEYMSRVRGGSNSTLIRISETPVQAGCWEVDMAVAIDQDALKHMKERFTDDTVVLAESDPSGEISNLIEVAMKEHAKSFGSVRYANTYMAGFVFGLLRLDKAVLNESIVKQFKDDTVNVEVADSGYDEGANVNLSKVLTLPQSDKEHVKKLHLMDGTTASGFGFLSGGCNMVTAYPMSPSTGVLNFMASSSKQFRIAVEQSEDEIASLTMVLGGWYAGARAMTTTSGGGFALMGEALSLSGMTETPAVIYLAQRPGPATGLPTRSEQGDLSMAIYSGHGPFERVVFAPGTLEECIECGYLAFELADRYQIPVIFLGDEYLADAMAMISDIDFSAFKTGRYIVESDEGYRRYANAKDGISPRSVPGFGKGLVCAVGDEHDEVGQITEDHQMRVQMVDKRARKREAILKSAPLPKISGEGSIAIIGWGSTYGAISEALSILDDPRLCHVHFAWVHPLSEKQLEVLDRYEQRVVVENNADGLFANQLKLHDIKIDEKILQYDGFAFFADRLAQMIVKTVKE